MTGVSSQNTILYHYIVTNDAISTFGHYGRGAKETTEDILGGNTQACCHERMLGRQSKLDIPISDQPGVLCQRKGRSSSR